jgi:hypothetical protein
MTNQPSLSTLQKKRQVVEDESDEPQNKTEKNK